MTKQILIVDDIHPIFIERAEALGYVCHYQPDITKQQAFELLPAYQGLVIRSKFQVDAQVLDLATSLQFISRAGAGMDNIDEQYAQQKKHLPD